MDDCRRSFKSASIIISTSILLTLFASHEAHSRITRNNWPTENVFQNNDRVDNCIKELLGDDKLGKAVLNFINAIPSSPQSRSHASRFFSSVDWRSKRERAPTNAIKGLLSFLFDQEPITCPKSSNKRDCKRSESVRKCAPDIEDDDDDPSDDSDQMSAFYKNIMTLIGDEESQELLIKVIDSIPSYRSRNTRELSHKILAHLDQSVDYVKRRNKITRSKTLASHDDIKIITGRLLDLYTRRRCECGAFGAIKRQTKCSICSKQEVETVNHIGDKNNCSSSDNNDASYLNYDSIQPTIEASIKTNDYDYDFVNRLSDDHVTEAELAQPKKCRGFTCEFEKTCGKADLNPLTSKSNQSGYISGGQDEIYGEWPSFVALHRRLWSTPIFTRSCGGVLISNRHVLTAAHCVRDYDVVISKQQDNLIFGMSKPEDLRVLVGWHKTRFILKDRYERKVDVEHICSAKRYRMSEKPFGLYYDFAVLTLKHEVEFNDHVQPACLPYEPISSFIKDAAASRQKCFVVGAGLYDGENLSTVVQKLPMVRTSCRQFNLSFDDNDRSRHCFIKSRDPSEYGGKECQGDSGGPILCLNPTTKRWTIAALVSYGPRECDQVVGRVSVYTRIPTLIEEMQRDCGI